ncbi:hypothetical protein MD484_g8408, partial [Candolleomyces efflorescens]
MTPASNISSILACKYFFCGGVNGLCLTFLKNVAPSGMSSLCTAPSTGSTSLTDSAKQSAYSTTRAFTASLSFSVRSSPIVTSLSTSATLSSENGSSFLVNTPSAMLYTSTGSPTSPHSGSSSTTHVGMSSAILSFPPR